MRRGIVWQWEDHPVRITPFQWRVYQAVLEIPLGQTRSYQWVAQRIGRPGAVRAVGQALRKNPFPLVIPCHRVVRADGTAGGYAGSPDDPRKRELLALEQQIKSAQERLASQSIMARREP